jgi:hypothetical protein
LAKVPDAPAIRRKQEEVFACIAAVRAAGGEVDALTSNLMDGDNGYRHVEDQFADYKRTSKDDPVKRNNVRGDIIGVGATMAGSYSAAASAATDAASARAVRLSILRALDASVARQMCFLYQLDPQCGRNGVNEDHDDDKAGQEYARITRPLLDAHGLAVQKLWGFGGATTPDNGLFFTALLRPALLAIDYANAKFNEYKSVDSGGDPARKNNVRQVVLQAGRAEVAALRYAFDAAVGYNDPAGMTLVGTTILAALAPAITRWLCYLTGAQGCDTFAVSEDQNNVKADQEYAATVGPLSDLYMRVAPKLISWNVNLTAYEPFVTLKLRRCAALNDFTNAKFAEYKGVDSGWDPVRKNNVRQVVLRAGRLLADCSRDAMDTAIVGAKAQPPTVISQVTPALLASIRTGVAPMMMTVPVGRPAMSGLGLTDAAPTAAALTVAAAGKRMIMAVVVVAKAALDASLARQLCYLFGQPGCDTFGSNEDSNSVKAQQESDDVGKPLAAVIAQAANFLNGKGDPQAEVALIKSKLIFCNALSARVNAKFAEFRSVDWGDPNHRNNIRNDMYAVAQRMVQCLRDTNPKTDAGRALVKPVVDAAWQASIDRMNCYLDRASNCGRGALAAEPTNEEKGDNEHAAIFVPLGNIKTRLASGQALSGLGQIVSEPVNWLGAALVLGGAWWLLSRPQPVRRNKRTKKRTSRRMAA